MGIGVVLPHVVLVLLDRCMRCQFFQPHIVVVVQAGFVVIDEHRSGDVHRIGQHQSFADAAFVNSRL